jgi:hydrogenase maturation protease
VKTLIMGVGNLLRRDDGAGIHVVNRLKKLAPQIDAVDVAMGGVEILEAMRGYDRVIIVDSIRTGSEPGRIYRVNIAGGEEPPRISSSHGVDLVTTLELGRRLMPGEIPTDQLLIGIEAEDTVNFSVSCTPRVEAAVDRVVKEILMFVGQRNYFDL